MTTGDEERALKKQNQKLKPASPEEGGLQCHCNAHATTHKNAPRPRQRRARWNEKCRTFTASSTAEVDRKARSAERAIFFPPQFGKKTRTKPLKLMFFFLFITARPLVAQKLLRCQPFPKVARFQSTGWLQIAAQKCGNMACERRR